MPDPEITTLAGGERVATEPLRGVRSVALGLWIGTGSRDEPSSRAGVSHFIEHLLFKGSSRYSARDIAELFDALGGELNAATSRETTVVYARVPDDRVEQALDVMTDMVFAPAFADVDSEREVVLEEIAMVDDNPQDLVHDLAAEAVFGTHPLGRPVIGRAEVIAGVSPRALRSYHGGAYVGPNVVLAASGRISHDRLVAMLEARRPASNGDSLVRRSLLRRVPAPGYRFLRRRTEQYHVVLAGPGIPRDDERRYAVSLLDAILGGSASSRLFQEIREIRGMAYSVYTYGSQYAETGQIGIYVGTREDNLDECLTVTAAELRDIAGGGLRPGELERAKENLKGRLLLSLESTSSRMTRLGKALVTDAELVSADETIRRVMAVTEEDVTNAAATLFAPERLSAAGIGPKETRFRAAVARVNPVLGERS
ncbi:pitrilysin family protein [Gaiella sp.]|uniref:M16 family metallopeptidase n=1 Tax=Gaiella sp. TaxID=2663207 RepID=UPI002CB0FEBA|nr:pitrilysin family protein [Gaiella sp.]HWO79490.1 pitrilysin family protein [Gaiella sp.]